jgi:hypothetical protein
MKLETAPSTALQMSRRLKRTGRSDPHSTHMRRTSYRHLSAGRGRREEEAYSAPSPAKSPGNQ